jgi:uncharacterized membrane protein
MNNIDLLINQALTGIQGLTIDSFLAIGLIFYFTSKIVGWAYSPVAKLFWLALSLFIFYKVATFVYPVISLPFFSALAMFYTTFPVVKQLLKKIKFKRKAKVPDCPKYQPRFGLTEKEKREKEKRELEDHKKRQEYLTTLKKKLDSF